MKAVVAAPPVIDFYFTPTRASALGATAVKKILEEYGITAVLLNFPTLIKKKPAKLSIPDELQHLNSELITGEHGPLSFFTKYGHYGPSMIDCAKIIISEKPELLFISCFAWAYACETLELAATVRKLNPSIKIIAGGAGVSVNPEFFESDFDFILAGEAESVLPGFIEEQISLSADLTVPAGFDAAPISAPNILSRFYWNETGVSVSKNIRFISAILTRGCPKACRFCANYLVHGRQFRKTPLNEISLSLSELPVDMNIHLNFEDDNLLLDPDYFFSVLKLVKQKFPTAEFSAENGLDYTMLNEDKVRLLTSLGFKSFNLSMASSSDSLLKREHRQSNLNRLKLVLNTAAETGARSTTYFICGLGGDSPETTLDNLITLHHLPTLTGISMFYPVPGLPGFDTAKMKNFSPKLCAGSSAWPWTGSLTSRQMITAFRLSRFSNLIKTLEGRISGRDGECGADDLSRQLVETILQKGRLHTLVKHRITEVPPQDESLVKGFLDSIDLTKINLTSRIF